MTLNKKIFFAVGPFAVAALFIVALLYSPIDFIKDPSDEKVHEAASSMSVNVLKGSEIKRQAMGSGKYLPFFGSSELSRVNPFHPSVLAKKYDRSYEPFLLGAPGTQSLTHFFMLNSVKKPLENKKLVFIISPQWFVKKGVSDPMYSLFYSPIETYEWLVDLDETDKTDQYVAGRLLEFESVKSDTQLKKILLKVKNGEELSQSDRRKAYYKYKRLKNEDLLFGQIGIVSKNKRIDKQVTELPNQYNFDELDTLAYKIGHDKTDNNPFEISNSFYSNRIMPMKGKLKNSQKNFNYMSSPEYGDFEAFLELLDKNNIDAMFVIPPVNKLWSDYTGLSTEMLDNFSKKINYQLKSQGFNNVVDFTNKRGEKYFMEDTIHIGWRGWLEMDTYLQEFLKSKQKPDYKMNPELFYSKEWQTKDYQ